MLGSLSLSGESYDDLTDLWTLNVTTSDQDANSDSVTSMIGIVQALISIFLDDGDKLRCINAGSTRIVFLLRPPLYYVCVSSWGEPESVVSTYNLQSCVYPLTIAMQD